jgi:mRNA-degrading endonuclease toxin of MazEF toxin-antitoxin module
MKPKRGEVVLVYFPHSDLVTIKLRPILVVQADDLPTGIPQFVAAMVSSNMDRIGPPSRVVIRPAKQPGTGLRTDSVIMTDNLATIELRLVNRIVGRIADMAPVDRALRATLAL